MNKIKKWSTRLFAVLAGVGGVLYATGANAQIVADTDVQALAAETAETVKVNIIDALTTNIGLMLAAGLAVLIIFFVWRLTKRIIKG